MSSLYSMIRGQKIASPNYFEGVKVESVEAQIVPILLKALRPPECILVNVQSVFADVYMRGVAAVGMTMPGEDLNVLSFKEMGPCKPAFPSIFMEWTSHTMRLGVQVIRDPDAKKFVMCGWEEIDGVAVGPLFIDVMILGEEDIPIDCQLGILAEPAGNMSVAHQEGVYLSRAFVAAQALARMNCRNVELRPITGGGKHRNLKAARPVPASVWNEIHITSVPKIHTTGRSAFPGECDENKRAFWIRGHYADYRKGNGLFGNPKLKAVFWIPEQRRGNEELGQVIPEYTIQ